MKLCRFELASGRVSPGLLGDDDATVLDLSGEVENLTALLETVDLRSRLGEMVRRDLPRRALRAVRLLTPIERQEVWAAGVTYLRSKKARMDESDFSATAYDKVYATPRPELFFKSLPEKVAGPGDWVGIRADATWSVPEPELALVINSRGELAGFTIGNDMSSRDLEGENLLYLPQAKIYEHSCGLGPVINVAAGEAEARTWSIQLTVARGGQPIFQGETSVGQIKRSFTELLDYLCRSQRFPHGVVLLTGTGIVPPDDFTLRPNDEVTIGISGVGTLRNVVASV